MLAVPGEPLVGKPKLRTPLYRTVKYCFMASPLSNPHLSSVTHTQPTRRWQETQRQQQLAPSTASSIRHRRLRHRPSRGRGAYQAGARRGLCAGAGSIVTDVSGGKQSKEPRVQSLFEPKSKEPACRCFGASFRPLSHCGAFAWTLEPARRHAQRRYGNPGKTVG